MLTEPLTFLAPLEPCEYLAGRLSQLRYEVNDELRPQDYMQRLRNGWRRFGPIVFRPECPSCRMCQSIRVPVQSFRPNQSQRRTWKKNAGEVTIRVASPSASPEKLDLLARFHQHGHATKGWPAASPDLNVFLDNPFQTEEWTYYLGETLVAVSYVDTLPEGLSAIYCFHDSDHRRSLGTLNILQMIEVAKQRGLPHVYLGYYVDGCRSLEYKRRFRPNEVLGADGSWSP